MAGSDPAELPVAVRCRSAVARPVVAARMHATPLFSWPFSTPESKQDLDYAQDCHVSLHPFYAVCALADVRRPVVLPRFPPGRGGAGVARVAVLSRAGLLQRGAGHGAAADHPRR